MQTNVLSGRFYFKMSRLKKKQKTVMITATSGSSDPALKQL